DPDAAAAFYTKVFGWTHEESEMPSGPYHIFTDGDEFRAGMMAITPEMGEMPPSWSVYLAVADMEAAVARVRELGGRVEGEVMDIEGVGKMAVTADPTGAYFMMMESVFQE
ncbi:MAG: VOC family protein, partial [Acidimicrobiia bacterium]|nr:VOC family protein [Acidimicrobiia bacterium]